MDERERERERVEMLGAAASTSNREGINTNRGAV